MTALTIVFGICVGVLQCVLDAASLASFGGLCVLYYYVQREQFREVAAVISALAGFFLYLSVLFFPSWLGGASSLGYAQKLPIGILAAGLGIWTLQVTRSLYRSMTIHRWPFVVREIKGEELKELESFFYRQACQYAGFYKFGAQLERAYLVQNPNLEQRLDDFSEGLKRRGKNSNRKMLFHGTSTDAAYNIVRHGFRLPSNAGMFGKGIYFAPCPQKSIQYMRGKGQMLLCKVDVGKARLARSSWNALEPARDLKRGWFARAIGLPSFDSVEASDGFLGCVRVSESIVYSPAQAVPYAVLVVRQTKASNSI